MTSKPAIFDDRPGIGSSHPVFSSRASGSGLPELQESADFRASWRSSGEFRFRRLTRRPKIDIVLVDPGVIRGMSLIN